MEVKDFYAKALAAATHIVETVSPDDYELPTPDTAWNVRDLLNHMLSELGWAAEIMRGKTMVEVGSTYEGNLVDDNVPAKWLVFADAAMSVLDDVDLQVIAHLSYGDVSQEEYIWQNGSDLAIHAWDLGEALDNRVRFAPDLSEALYAYAKSHQEQLAASELFGEQIEVPDEAETQVKLLGLYGRSQV